MSIRKVNRSDTANGPWVVNNMHDNQEKYYIFKYKCPNCGNIDNISLPMINGVLDDNWTARCKKCNHETIVAYNKSNILEIFRRIVDEYSESEKRIHSEKILVNAVTACAANVVKADNAVKREEIKAYKDFCRAFFNENVFDYAAERLKFYLANSDKIYKSIGVLKNTSPEFQRIILELLCEIASCDGDFAQCEQDAISKLVSDLSFSTSKWKELKEKYLHSSDEYKVLGISFGASFEEVKTAYHKKCKEFHPDLYQNLPQSFQEFANQKFKEVQEAFDKLRKKYEK